MKLALSENISKLRKQNAMTQEQLAEALGVTFASVSKWERGVATPELRLIAEMADLFEVSLDALVGFELQGGGVAAQEKKISELQSEKRYEEAIKEAEKALLRFPNDFRIVYQCGQLYAVAGIEWRNEKYIKRGIELLEYSILLIAQNNDLMICEGSIRYMIAQSYIILRNHEKAIEIMKKDNVNCAHSAMIALTYMMNDIGDEEEIENYMMGAFSNIVSAAIHTMLAYGQYYYKKKDYASGSEAMKWLIDTLQAMKQKEGDIAYVDKIIAPCYVEYANFSLLLGDEKTAEQYLRRAYAIAAKFDATPTYKATNMKFCIGEMETATLYDSLGESAMTAVEIQTLERYCDPALRPLWEKVAEEEEGGKA
jgi:transcriptional regulator with XRE-family HTH domain